jgi:hypothetical protein
MEQIQAGITSKDGRDEQRVCAAVDVPESAPLFDGTTQVKKAAITDACDHQTAAIFDRDIARHGEVHPGRE